MKRFLAACVATLHIPLAHAQANPHAHHDARQAQPEPAASAAAPATSATGQYRSPFADYRPFKADEPMKDWRKANDEVREAGGHIGLMKGEPAQLTGHGAHGAKQPPAKEKK